jgi:hypothetical protein
MTLKMGRRLMGVFYGRCEGEGGKTMSYKY